MLDNKKVKLKYILELYDEEILDGSYFTVEKAKAAAQEHFNNWVLLMIEVE